MQNEGLLSACARGDSRFLCRFIRSHSKRESYQVYDNHHWGPLHHAVVSNYIQAVQELISTNNVNLHDRNFEGETALFLAVSRESTKMGIIEVLLRAEPETIDIPNNASVYPLHVAIKNRRLDLVQLMFDILKEMGVHIIDQHDWEGETYVMCATRNQDVDMIAYLVDNMDCDFQQRYNGRLDVCELAGLCSSENKPLAIGVLELLVPEAYGPRKKVTNFNVRMVLAIWSCWGIENFEAIDWFLEKFYSKKQNTQHQLIDRFALEYREDNIQRFYAIVPLIHSKITDIFGQLSREEIGERAHYFGDLYIDFFHIFHTHRHVFDELAPIYMDKVKSIPITVLALAMGRFFAELDPQRPARGTSIAFSFNGRMVMEFLDNFQLHTRSGIDKILASGCFHKWLQIGSQVHVANYTLPLLLPFYVGVAPNNLRRFFNRTSRRGARLQQLAIPRLDLVVQTPQPMTLLEISRIKLRKYIFSLRIQPGTPNPDGLQLQRLMALPLPLRLKNYLRYNVTDYMFR